MSTTSSTVDKVGMLREKALLNIETLFSFWGINFVKVNEIEYDFISTMREDNNFGAVRFNVEKGLGADFASTTFTSTDFNSIGAGFSREDFGFSKNQNISYGFDIIGLCQRVHGLGSYRDATTQLKHDLNEANKYTKLQTPSLDAHIKRQQKIEEAKKQRVDWANRLLRWSTDYVGTVGEKYLAHRSISLLDHEKDIRFHRAIMCKEAGKPLPALLFVIRDKPDGEIFGVQRIYIQEDGKGKANIDEPKKALGDVKGRAIWFGEPNETLHLVEGPENTLTVRMAGAPFCCCAVFSGNMPSIQIPGYVKKLIICPDRDKAGLASAAKTKSAHKNIETIIRLPKEKLLSNGKYADFNDLIMGVE